MIARLTLSDWSRPEDGVELSNDWASCLAFWSAVLELAAADDGDAVYFHLRDDDECLAIEIGNDRFALEPPPREYRRRLLGALTLLAAGSRPRQRSSNFGA